MSIKIEFEDKGMNITVELEVLHNNNAEEHIRQLKKFFEAYKVI
jgi:hypothetical protein